jgi:hypothetical protein
MAGQRRPMLCLSNARARAGLAAWMFVGPEWAGRGWVSRSCWDARGTRELCAVAQVWWRAAGRAADAVTRAGSQAAFATCNTGVG